jgi:hypothetical protein
MLDKEQILKADDIKTKTVKIPEWKGEVKIKMLTGAERDELETITYPASGEKTARENIRAIWCIFSIVDDNGNRIFSKVDIDSLGKKSSAALDRIFTAALSLNKVTNKDIEDMEKNSEAAPAESSILS